LDTHVKQILKEGANDFIQKPFALKTIADKIKELLENEKP
jgi:FixJ family two-component response regulator